MHTACYVRWLTAERTTQFVHARMSRECTAAADGQDCPVNELHSWGANTGMHNAAAFSLDHTRDAFEGGYHGRAQQDLHEFNWSVKFRSVELWRCCTVHLT